MHGLHMWSKVTHVKQIPLIYTKCIEQKFESYLHENKTYTEACIKGKDKKLNVT